MGLGTIELKGHMPEKTSELKLPHGLSRLAFRLPIWLYHSHLGWLLGTRFVLLTHTGRKSGLSRQTVLEVVRYDKDYRSLCCGLRMGK